MVPRGSALVYKRNVRDFPPPPINFNGGDSIFQPPATNRRMFFGDDADPLATCAPVYRPMVKMYYERGRGNLQGELC